jgi:methyl-accepting chemotaxis protein
MDQVTQSNSAQTEELSATAESLSDQAAHLLRLVQAFKLSNTDGAGGESAGAASHPVAPRPKARKTKPAPVKAKAVKPAPAFAAAAVAPSGGRFDADFEEF